MLKQRADKLITILCNSLIISHYADQALSIPDLAVDYKKLKGSFQQDMDEALKEFEGASLEDVEKPIFKKRLDRIESKISSLVDDFKEHAPEPILRKKPSDEESKYLEDGSISTDENPIVKKWVNRFTSMGGNTCYKFESDDLNDAKRKLLDIAKYQIKLEAMERVSDQVSLDGSFKFQQEFESVPDACRFYRKQLGDNFSRELLKQKIKRRAVIYDDGEILEDWATINGRINSWLSHEKNKYA